MPAAPGPEPARFSTCDTCSGTLGIPVLIPHPDAERHARAHAPAAISDAFAGYVALTRGLPPA